MISAEFLHNLLPLDIGLEVKHDCDVPPQFRRDEILKNGLFDLSRVNEVNESSMASSEAYVLFYELDGTTFSRL